MGFIAVFIATAPAPKTPTAAATEKSALEAHLITGAAYGDSEEEKTLASKVFSSMQKDEGLPAKAVGVAVRIKLGATKRVIILVEVATRKDLHPKARRDLVDDVRRSIADDLDSKDVVSTWRSTSSCRRSTWSRPSATPRRAAPRAPVASRTGDATAAFRAAPAAHRRGATTPSARRRGAWARGRS